jgi:aryl-alcohol dehydrogenase-like predicted oxidoreductase
MAQLALGTMNFGKRTPEAEARNVVARALDVGITVFDTANVYGDGQSEKILGRALGARRNQVTVASKVGLGRVGGRPEGLSRDAIVSSVDASLMRLGCSHLDILYLHAPDGRTPFDETLEAVDGLVKAGKVKTLGISNHAAWQILDVMHLAESRGWPRPTISQVMYNLLMREVETEYIPFSRRHPLHTTVYNPLAGGLLAGKLRPGDVPAPGSRFASNKMYVGRYLSPRMFERVTALEHVARADGLTLLELAYAWLAGRPGVDSILVGPATVAHLDDALLACQKSLSPSAIAAVDDLHLQDRGTDAHYVR